MLVVIRSGSAVGWYVLSLEIEFDQIPGLSKRGGRFLQSAGELAGTRWQQIERQGEN